jgi:hypothetical protein
MFGIELYVDGMSEAGRVSDEREELVKIEDSKGGSRARLYSILLVPEHSGIGLSEMSVHEADLGD